MTAGSATLRSYDPIDLSSRAFWPTTAAERERSFAVLRAERPVSWHLPVQDALMPDPDDPGFWAVTRRADIATVSRNHEVFLSGKGVVFENVPDRPGEDLFSSLVNAEVDGDRLTDAEVAAFFAGLSVAANDTTRQTISHAMKALTDFPDERAWLLEDFDGRIGGAIEEFIRWASAVMTFRRTAATDSSSVVKPSKRGTKW